MIVRLASLVVLLWALGFALFVVALPQPAEPAATDAIVVLTGGPGRIQRGLALLRKSQAKRMLISGADPTVRPHELALEYAAPLRLFDCCIDLGREAVDTRSNADETVRWIERRDYRTIRLVTTDWHMRRARFELAHALGRSSKGESVRIIGDAVKSDPGFRVLMVEYNKYLLRRAAVPLGI